MTAHGGRIWVESEARARRPLQLHPATRLARSARDAEVSILSGRWASARRPRPALSDLLGIPHAVIDVDALSWCFPARPTIASATGSRCRTSPRLAQLSRRGARRLILVRVIENAETLAAYRAIFGGSPVALVRLTAAAEAIAARIAHRSAGEDVQGELARARELSEKSSRAQVSTESWSTRPPGRRPGSAAGILERTGFGQERS